MTHSFEGKRISEGNRTFIDIPFDVWEATGCKGNIPVKAKVGNLEFECKLVPKGNGHYYIPVKKAIADKLSDSSEVSFEVISSLTRISGGSPYSKEHPIRRIDGIKDIDIIPGFCGHCSVAMLAGVTLEDVKRVMGKEEGSWSRIMETLDYYGIQYEKKMVYPKGEYTLPRCAIVFAGGGYKLWFDGEYRGRGVGTVERIVSYLEIMVP